MKNSCSFFLALLFICFLIISCEKDNDILDHDTPLYSWNYFDKSNGLPSDSINFIFQDKDGDIWVATRDKGVSKYSSNTWTNYNEDDGLLKNKVSSIAQDNDGDIWFATSRGFSVWQGSGFTNVEKTSADEWIYADKMIKDKRGWIWATDDYNIGFYLYDGYSIYYFDFGGDYTYVTSIGENSSGNVYLAYFGGVFIFYVNSSGEQKWKDYTYSNKIYADYTNAMLFDSRGSSWFGHLGADKVTRINGMDAEYINLYNGWSYTNVTSILEDDKQNIWFTMSQGGVIKYNGIEPETFGLNTGLTDETVTCSMKDGSGNIWFGTKSGGICVYQPTIGTKN
jgi:ligand-binding sensor domain-containing protein